MTPEQAIKHKPVIEWWLENTNKGVWARYSVLPSNWGLTKTPRFDEKYLYIQNDEYAELRMAQADGGTIQEDIQDYDDPYEKPCWVSRYNFDFKRVLGELRIKPNEPKFKVGDWLRTLPNKGHLTPAPIFKIEGCLTRYNVDAVEIWEPREGDIVVYYNNHPEYFTIAPYQKTEDGKHRLVSCEGRITEVFSNVIPHIGQSFEELTC